MLVHGCKAVWRRHRTHPQVPVTPKPQPMGVRGQEGRRDLWGGSESRALNDSTWKTRNLSASSRRGQRGGEPGSSKALRKPQRQVNSDPAPGNRQSRAFALTGCLTLLLPALACAQGARSSPAVPWEETRPRDSSASSACLCHSCPRGG